MRSKAVLVGVLGILSASGCYEGLDAPRGSGPDLRSGWFQFPGGVEYVEYEVVDGVALLDGDIILGRVDELDGAQRGDDESDRGAGNPNNRWPNAELFYRFDDDLPQATRDAVEGAMARLQRETAVTFVRRTDEDDYVTITRGAPGVCASWVGRTGGEQELWLADECIAYERTVLHELSHALGLYHEQSRRDRDKYVEVHWHNIAPGKESNFQIYTEGVDLGMYDFDSIMHYSSGAFAASEDVHTITRKDGSPIAYNMELSAGDIAALDGLYIYGPFPCGNGVVEATEACDLGPGNDTKTIYRGGTGLTCGTDPEEVCRAGCSEYLTVYNGGLRDCDAYDDCEAGVDCWMSSRDGGCDCNG